MTGRQPLGLRERLDVEAALDIAFEPLRAERTSLSPRRVRAAVRWGRGAPPAALGAPAALRAPAALKAPAALRAPAALKAPAALRWSGAIARLSELSVAVGMSVVIFAAAFGPGGAARPPATGGSAARVDEADIYPLAHVTAPLDDEQYIRWLRLDRYVPLQDWLDPSVVRAPLPRRLDLPASRDPSTTGPY